MKTSPIMPKVKTTVSFISAAGAAAIPASAAIKHTELAAPLTISAGDSIYFSLSEEWAGSTNASGAEFRLNFDTFPVASSRKPRIQSLSSSAVVRLPGESYVAIFGEGVAVNDQRTFISGNQRFNWEDRNFFRWPVGTRGYVGLRIDGAGNHYFGWADVEYTTDRDLRLYSFAYEDSGDAIPAGAIPEPKTTALLAALAAGSVVMLGRRRRAAQAA